MLKMEKAWAQKKGRYLDWNWGLSTGMQWARKKVMYWGMSTGMQWDPTKASH